MRIVLDAMGGDHAPDVTVEGALAALKTYPSAELILVGQQEQIEARLNGKDYDRARLSVVNATEVITNDEAPVLAVRKKKDSSVVVGMKMVRDGQADAFVSAGSTGAVLVGATLIIKTMQGIIRPALATLMPTTDKPVLVVDCGANVDAKPEHLLQFAVMGDVYMRKVWNTENPRVGLVNIGAESEKGNALTKAVYPRLSEMPLNFVGNVEARDIPQSAADIVVCDAFVGNVILKLMEGSALAISRILKKELTANIFRKLCALGLKEGFRSFKKTFDYAEYGGAPMLGLNACVIKAHGSSNARAIECAVGQAVRYINGNVTETLRSEMEHLSDQFGE